MDIEKFIEQNCTLVEELKFRKKLIKVINQDFIDGDEVDVYFKEQFNEINSFHDSQLPHDEIHNMTMDWIENELNRIEVVILKNSIEKI